MQHFHGIGQPAQPARPFGESATQHGTGHNLVDRLTLSLDGMTSLPNGGPLHVVVGPGKFSVGRHEDRDWVLPDPTRQISRHHFDIEFIKGTFYAIDRSAMGTRLEDPGVMLQGPHPLKDGDVLQIGQYRVLVRYGTPQATPVVPESAGFIDDAGQAHEAGAAAMPLAAAVQAARNGVPAPAAAPAPVAAPAPAPAAPSDAMLRAFCAAAGTDPDAVKDAAKLGTQLAEAMRVMVAHLLLMEQERRAGRPGLAAEAIPAISPNPLDKDLDTDAAIAALFFEDAPGQLDGNQALLQSIERLVMHQRALDDAQIPAVAGMLRGLAPDDVANAVDSGMFGNLNKSKAWDRFTDTWQNKTRRTDGRMLDVYHLLVAEQYQHAMNKPKIPKPKDQG